ncbi:substrate-binding domain-containing protein [Bradyrhizobium sp. McL0616]|uniref:substrate-binding domain-containing protein n=1 Tax=Bradyrhizobium sp. McL0616 TaxID=3415674 RepID=UPI003CED3428
MRASHAVITALLLAISVTAVRAEPAKVFAAGSLVVPLKQAIKAAGLDASQVADPVFGPSGGLRERIEKGEAADLFLSADTGHPRRLAAERPQALMISFARNNLCLFSREAVGLTEANALETMLAPKIRLATSTPVVDPGGDYAFAVFKRAEKVRAGADAVLSQKALQLIGGPAAIKPLEGHSPAASIFLADKADLLLVYCSGQQQTLREVPGLKVTRLPSEIDVVATYGLALLTDNPAAARLALFLLSDKGQDILAENGLVKIAPSER